MVIARALKTERSIIAAFARRIQTAVSVDQAVDALYDTALRCGYQRLVYARGKIMQSKGRLVTPADLSVRNFPTGWEGGYAQRGCFDPYFLYPCSSMAGTQWSDIHSNAGSFPRPVRDFIDWSRHLGFRDGFSVPVRVSGQQHVIISGIDTSVDSAASDLFLLAANYFANELDNRFRRAQRSIALSRREEECLFWFGQGKSIEDIGTILSVSQESVRTYFKRVTAKLDASNRTHALVKAMGLGLI